MIWIKIPKLIPKLIPKSVPKSFYDNWEWFIDRLEADKHGKHIVLQPNQFLSDVINADTNEDIRLEAKKRSLNMISEGDKVKLRTGEIALIAEVLEDGVMYVAEIFTKSGVTVDHLEYIDIASVFIETENPIATIS